MQHWAISKKFSALMIVFGVCSLAVALYMGSQINQVSRNYQELLQEDSRAAVSMARSNRFAQTIRASVADVVLAGNNAARDAAVEEYIKAIEKFTSFVEAASAAVPEKTEIGPVKADFLSDLKTFCEPLITSAKSSAAGSILPIS